MFEEQTQNQSNNQPATPKPEQSPLDEVKQPLSAFDDNFGKKVEDIFANTDKISSQATQNQTPKTTVPISINSESKTTKTLILIMSGFLLLFILTGGFYFFLTKQKPIQQAKLEQIIPQETETKTEVQVDEKDENTQENLGGGYDLNTEQPIEPTTTNTITTDTATLDTDSLYFQNNELNNELNNKPEDQVSSSSENILEPQGPNSETSSGTVESIDLSAIDSDKDGLNDAREKELGTNPNSMDTDEDGLDDYQEVIIYETDPLNPDTDEDGYTDGTEIKNNYNPNGSGKLLETK